MFKFIPLIFIFMSPVLICGSKDSSNIKQNIFFTYENTFSPKQNFGLFLLSYEIGFNETISFNYRFGLGNDRPVERLQVNSGIKWGLRAFRSPKDSDFYDDDEDKITFPFYLLNIFLFILPEGVNYKIPVNEKSYISLFANPLGYEYIKDDSYWTCDLGVRFSTKFYKNLLASSYVGYKYCDHYTGSGMIAAFSLGVEL